VAERLNAAVLKSRISRLTRVTNYHVERDYHNSAGLNGHHLLRVPFRYVTIKPDANADGHVRDAGLSKGACKRLEMGVPTPRDLLEVERDILCSYAGVLSERRFVGRYSSVGSHHDRQRAVELILRIESGRSASAYARYLNIKADEMLNESWHLVETVANELLLKTTLTSKEVAGVCLRAFQCSVRSKTSKHVSHRNHQACKEMA
jgi:hypothetical protein